MFAVLADINKVIEKVNETKSENPELVCNVAAINSPKQFIVSGSLPLLNLVKKF